MNRLFRYLILSVLFLMFKTNLYSQYLGDALTLSSYEGVWKWETQDESLVLYLRDTTWKWGNMDYRIDIIGTYKYVKNDCVIIDNTDIVPSALEVLLDMPIYAQIKEKDEFGNIWVLRLLFKDTLTGKESSLLESTLMYSLGRYIPELTIRLVDDEKWYEGMEDELASSPAQAEKMKRKAQAAHLPGWSIPNNVVLKKVVD